MYTDGFDELSEAENRPPRTYVSSGAQDTGKLQRENEKLKKSLEKEQFFNRLLDQELKDIKGGQVTVPNYTPENFAVSSGVSKGSFNFLLIVTIALAAFLAYTLYFNKQYNLFANRAPLAITLPETTPPAATVPPVIKDSVPNIIAGKKDLPAVKQSVAESKPEQKKSQITAAEPKAKAKPATAQPDASTEEALDDQAQTDAANIAAAQAVPDQRPAVGTYIVSSKANFYSEPNENTLRSYFISPGVGADKLVNALEDKNGFIYVEFKNDIGYITKGWLSKADLTVK